MFILTLSHLLHTRELDAGTSDSITDPMEKQGEFVFLSLLLYNYLLA